MTQQDLYGDVRFKHIHRYNSNGIVNKGGLTLAYCVYADSQEPSIVFNYAKCHTSEQYSRVAGREIAFSRFLKNASSDDIKVKQKNQAPGSWHRYNIRTKLEGPLNSINVILGIRDWFVEVLDSYNSFTDNHGNIVSFTEEQVDEYKEILKLIDDYITLSGYFN